MNIQGIENIGQGISIKNSPKPRVDLEKVDQILNNSGNTDLRPDKVAKEISQKSNNLDPLTNSGVKNREILEHRESVERTKARIEILVENQKKSFKAIKDLLYLITPGMEKMLEESNKKSGVA